MEKILKIKLDEFKKAQENLNSIINQTNLIYSDYFSKLAKNEIFLKPENLQLTGSYKIRGAYNKISSLSNKQKRKVLIAASAGNHAQGVALAAKKLQAKATIIMPSTTPLIKIKATQDLGAKVILYGNCYDDAYKEAKRLARKRKYIFIHPFNDKKIIAGQGTIGLEILEDLPEVDIVIVPIGGGGLISGIALAAKSINPKIKIIGVEPEGACAMKKSCEQNKRVSLDLVNTIADGVAVKEVGTLTYPIVKKYVDRIITVSEAEIMEAFLMLLEKHKLLAEPAGVLSLAVFFNKKLQIKNKKIVSLISGGNIDIQTIAGLVTRGLIKLGRIFEFSVELFDRPGELLQISNLLFKNNANIIKVQHDQFKSIDRYRKVKLTLTLETQGHDHINRIIKELEGEGYELKYHD